MILLNIHKTLYSSIYTKEGDPMTKAIIFDFDGLIVDTETVWYSIYKDYFQSVHDYHLSLEEFTICVGSDSKVLFQQIEGKLNTTIDIDQFYEQGRPLFIERSNHLPIMEGVEELILQAKDLGLKVALATSSQKERPLYHLDRLGILRHFDAITTSSEIKNRKPAPDLFLKSIEKLDIEPHEAIIFEDSNNGLIAGITAQIPVIVVPNSITRHSNFDGYYDKLDSVAHFNLKEHLKQKSDS